MPCRCALSALIVTRSAKVAVLHACAHAHATGQLSGTDLPASLPYSPTALAAFSRNREPSRDVPAKHRCAPVASLLGDDALGDPGSSSRGRQTGPQRVTGHLVEVEPGTGGVVTHSMARQE